MSEFSSTPKPKWLVIIAFLNFFGVVWTENAWFVFRVKIPFSSSALVHWGGDLKPVDSFTQVSILKKKRYYNYEGRWFSAITLKALWTDKKRHWIYVGNELRENRFVFRLFLHAFYKSAEMIKCFAIVVDIVAGYGGYWYFYSQIFDEFCNLIIIFSTKWANAINAVSTTSSGCHC